MPTFKLALGAVATITFVLTARAQEAIKEIFLYETRDGCESESGNDVSLTWYELPTCRGLTWSPADDSGWEPDDTGYYTAYANTDEVDDGCFLLLAQENPDTPGFCGAVYQQISNSQRCIPTRVQGFFQHIYCCGDGDCSTYIPTRDGGNSTAQPVDETAPPARRDVTPPTLATRDVTAIKRTSPFAAKHKRQSECKFNPDSDETINRVSRPQQVASGLSCAPGTEMCTIEKSISLSVEHTTGTEVSSELSASFFEVVQVSISFSYYTETTTSRTFDTTYTASLSPGTSGYLTFTQTLECSYGNFEGDCEWDTGESYACIPATINNEAGGEPRGLYQVILNSRNGSAIPDEVVAEWET